jgi:hypothetical protein
MLTTSATKYMYFGHHKCASTWILRIITAVCEHMGLRLAKYVDLTPKDIEEVDFIADTGADVAHLETLDSRQVLGFHVIRDPRDIVVSAYFSHRYSHPLAPWLEEQRRILSEVNFEEGIRTSIDFRAKQFQEMSNWDYENPNIFETRFETITKSSLDEFTAIFRFLGLYPHLITQRMLAEIVDYNNYRRLSEGREYGVENVHHHYRKGISGDWVNCFSKRNKDYFKQRYGSMLIYLGYEPDLDW